LREQDERRRKAEELKEQLNKVVGGLAQLVKEEQALAQPAPEDEAAEGENGEQAPRMTQEQISERRNALTDQKADLEAALAQAQEDRLEVKYPAAVKEEARLNLVIVGPEKCGKTTLANYLAQEH
jgi:polynucleotide 5'-kinase involved in rRNA processing